VAILIDGIIIGVVSGLLILLLGSDSILYNILSILLGAAYYIYFESSDKQGTVGKQLMNLKVTDERYERITVERALIRYLCKIPSALILMIGYIMAAFDSRKQSLHDKLAKTYVIRTKEG